MKSLLPWAKSNPITVGSAVLVVGSVIVLMWISSRGRAFLHQVGEREQKARQIRTLMQTSAKVPPLKPNDPDQEFSIAINQAAIDELTQVYSQMNEQYAQIRQLAVEFNQRGHEPMLDGLFPEPIVGKPHDAKQAYLQAFVNMLGPFDPDAAYPTLNASMPPTRGEMMRVAARAEQKFLNTRTFPPKQSVRELDEQQLVDLKRFKMSRLMKMLEQHSTTLHVYAQTDLDAPDFPFDVNPWSRMGDIPTADQLWWGQIGLWIQRDLTEAIATANRVSDPQANVIHAAVKRLIKVEIVPGYVGLAGALGGMTSKTDGHPRSSVQKNASSPVTPTDASRRIPDNFVLSPTGRFSNALYDVVHVWLTVDIDTARIPVFIDLLREVNFMTVLNVELSDVDEYDLLEKGYLYGTDDAVRLKALIETVWLREWTAPFMPQTVRRDLGLTPEEDSG